jgi:hypothetical protein
MHSTFHDQNGNFRTCGEIVATSIAQGSPSPCFLQPCAFDALWKELDVLNISDEDLTKEEHAVLDEVGTNCLSHGLGDLISSHPDICKPFFLEVKNSMMKLYPTETTSLPF